MLTQLLPGPASSQTGFFIGTLRAGLAGGFAAWLGFTLPSAVLMVLFAAGVRRFNGPLFEAALHGLQLAAIAVVADAVLRMARVLCPDLPRAAMALLATLLVWAASGSLAQILAILLGAVLGALFLPPPHAANRNSDLPVTRGQAMACFALFAVLFAALELAPERFTDVRLPRAFYQTGSLVFGGGHVVLPLLDQAVVRPGWVDPKDFLAGYGAAQAIPGPLFSFAGYLGFVAKIRPNGVLGAVLCIIALFLPGLLLGAAAAPFWLAVRKHDRARSMLAGVNAAVVGLLLVALVRAATSGIYQGASGYAITALAFAALLSRRVSPVVVVLTSSALAMAMAVIR